jgi:very-short-patch-repair endonuclease
MVRRRVSEEGAGAHAAKTAAARAMRRDMTPAEARLWAVLRGDALGCRVRRQHVIRGWIVDFYIPSARLVIEVDGEVHAAQQLDDARRTEALEAEGMRVLRVRNEEVENALPAVVAAIVAAMAY